MTKEEETELSKWVLSNKYFSSFIFYNDDQIELSLEDAKKYVVELAKYRIMRENEEKKAKILKNLNDL